MNNEPVAYLVKAPDGEYLVFKKSNNPLMADCTYISLYTHPAKTLTDEEINDLWQSMIHPMVAIDVVTFARAILRKAQEK
jgi:hypothetical protein